MFPSARSCPVDWYYTFLGVKDYENQVQAYYNEIIKDDNAFEKLSEINKKITKKFMSILEENPNLKKHLIVVY